MLGVADRSTVKREEFNRGDQAKMVKVVLAVNVGALAAVVAVALVALHGGVRLFVVGVLCAALTIGMYAAPMAAMVSKLARRSLLTHPPPPFHIHQQNLSNSSPKKKVSRGCHTSKD